LFQKHTLSIPSDTSYIFLVRTIQTRRCSSRKHAKTCKFLKVVIRNTIPELVRRRKKKSRAIVIRSQHFHKRNDGLVYNFFDNALVLLKKRMNTRGKEIVGPSSRDLRIRKFRKAFRFIF